VSAALIVMKLVGGRIWTWLSHRSFWQLVCMALAGFALLQHFQLAGERRHSAKVEAQALKCAQGREADRKSHETAQVQAKAKNEATLQRVKHEQDTITDNVEDRYHRDLARLHSELRPGTAKGAANGAGSPADGKAAGGPGEATGLPFPDSERLRAAENELQLDRLIDWVEQQSRVDPNRATPPTATSPIDHELP
jgi:hypothetical protein